MDGILEIVIRGVEEGDNGRGDGKEGTREDGWREGKQEGTMEEGREQVRRGNKGGGRRLEENEGEGGEGHTGGK